LGRFFTIVQNEKVFDCFWEFVFGSLFLLLGCNSIINGALEREGIYNDKQKLVVENFEDKKIVFLPMHHMGTQEFYDDVKSKIDSLKKENYYFLYEGVKDSKNDTLLRKERKMLGMPLAKPGVGYMEIMDSLSPSFSSKLKRQLIDQPSYEKLGIDSSNSKRADVGDKEMVGFYEKKYGEVKLSKCDFESSIYSDYPWDCKKQNKILYKNVNDVITNYRNEHVFNEIQKSPHKKIAIIYGEEHVKGIAEKLKK
jgi:hypothetical protein